MLPPEAVMNLSTGFSDLDAVLGEVYHGDTFLWLADRVEDFAFFARRLATWAGSMRYPSAFLDFGTPGLDSALRTCRLHLDLSGSIDLKEVSGQVRELANYPRNEPMVFFFDQPRCEENGCLVEDYLEFLEEIGPVLNKERHLTYFLLDPALLGTQQLDRARQLAHVTIRLQHREGQRLLQVERALDRYSKHLFHPHLVSNERLIAEKIADHAAFSRILEQKIQELYVREKELQRSISQLRQDENRLAYVLENSAEAIITLDRAGHVRSWNKGAERIFGYSAEEATGMVFQDFIDSEFKEHQEIRQVIGQLRESSHVSSRTYPARNRDGEKIYIELTNSTLTDQNKSVIGHSVIIREITGRVQSEQKVNRMLQELTLLRELSNLLLGTRDLEAILQIILIGVTSDQGLGFNRAFLLLSDEKTEVLRGTMAIGPDSPEEAARIWKGLREDSPRSLPEIYQRYRNQDAPKDVHVNEVVRGIAVPFADRENVLMRAMSTGEGELATANSPSPSDRAVLEQLGCTSCAVAPLISEERSLGVLLADNAITGTPVSVEELDFLCLVANHASSAVGRAYLHEELKKRLEDLETVTGELKENQRRMLKVERLRTVGEMAARVAHEIRNPLTAVGGLARKLREKDNHTPRDARYLEIIVNETMRLERIVTEIQTFTRDTVLELSLADLHQCLRDAVEMVQPDLQKFNVVIEMDLDAAVPPIVCDPQKMKQVFLNLLINGCHAMEKGGVLRIRTELCENHVRVDIVDEGCGMAEQVLKKVQEPFFTTKASGSGLGVTIAQQLVEAHHGFLSYTSEPDQGTTATVRLPLVRTFEESKQHHKPKVAEE
jgi:PAS domain S-box-containing protein